MRNKKINGVQFENMLKNGFQNLSRHEDEVNKLNVFPVPDGDTGTNMCLTLGNGIKHAKKNASIGVYAKTLSQGMLLGARGNSGVILSQFFKGVYTELSRSAYAGPGELRNALIRGYRTAYDSVIKPVEGTILTVAREGIEHIRGQITRNTTIEEILAMYIAEMKKTLSYTPEMLDVLKEAGVVDSGGQGFIYIFEGMLMYLNGEVFRTNEKTVKSEPAPQSGGEIDFSVFNENSSFEYGYCTEFILQLLKGEKYTQRFKLETYIEDIGVYGDSLVVVQDGKRVKVHIHTLKPAKVIALSQEYGEFLTFKMENMQLQHNEVLKKKIEPKKLPHKNIAKVSVVNGDGLKELFEDLGCDVVINCEETMNASSQEFIEAFKLIDADEIVVFPNNKNVILAAQQALELSGKKNIRILPSKSVAEGYFAIAMDVPDDENTERRLNLMESGLKDVSTLVATTATRDYTYHELTCRAGEEIVLLNGELVCVSADCCEGIIDGMKLVPDIDDIETCVVFCGADTDEEQTDLLAERLEEEFPMLDVEFIAGGQKHYRYIIGLC